jgi:outer membrane receptor protein involved in Fe transport
MIKNLATIILVLCTTLAFSQKGGRPGMGKVKFSLYGQVLDNVGENLPYVSIGVFKSKDSSYVAGAATEMNGKFSVKVPPGKYYTQISFLSFKTKTIGNISVTNADINLKKIKLEPSISNLEEFEVVEEKKLMELDLDKKVFNVSKDVTNQGADASEILDNVPSVSVDVEGNVSLRGSGNVRVLINGKPSGMMGMSTADVLKQMDATLIEKVEVITNPSARYDAEGEVGIINIVMKKDKRKGVNGSVNANFGYPNNYGGGYSITFKQKNYSVFTSYGASFRDSPSNTSNNHTFTYPDTSFRYTSEQEVRRFSLNNNFGLGTEIYLNQYNSLTISGKYSFGDGDNRTQLIYSDYDEFDEAVQTVDRNEIEDKDRESYGVNLNYHKTFKQKRRVFTFDFSYSDRLDNERSIIFQNNSVDATQDIEQRIYNYEGGKNWFFQTDYVHPYKKKGKIEFGLKHTIQKVDDDYAVLEFDDSLSSWQNIPGFNNFVLYDEYISAAYLMFGNKVKKFSYQFGVRTEYTDVRTELVTTQEINQRNYLNFFPSAHLSYEMKKENSLQLGYSKRIRRPHHYWLLPFFSYVDSRSNSSGNPNINPEYTDSYEVGHLKNWDKGSLLSNVYYRYSTDIMNWITYSDEEGITRRRPENLGTRDAYGIEFSGSYEIKKWWTLRGSYNFYREIQDGEFRGVEYDVDNYSWSTRFNSKWAILKKFNLQASFKYRAPKQTAQGESLANYSMDTGVSFDFLKGNGTFAFNIKDVFDSRRRESISFGENFVSENNWRWRSRFFRINLTYRINQKKKRGGDRNYEDYDGGGQM